MNKRESIYDAKFAIGNQMKVYIVLHLLNYPRLKK